MSGIQRPTPVDRRQFLGVLVASFLAACTSDPGEFAVSGANPTSPPDATASTTSRSTVLSSTTSTGSIAPPAEAESVEPLPAPMVELDNNAFGLGVASGEPDERSVVLWTRLVGELPTEFDMVWEVATDESMTTLVATGVVTVAASEGHSVRVLADGLTADQTYYYRFRAGSRASTLGRTRTLPANSSRRSIALALDPTTPEGAS